MDKQAAIVMSLIKEALGGHEKYFDITFGEFLVEEEYFQAMTIGIKPRKIDVEDGEAVGEKQLIQFDVERVGDEDYEYNLVIGEDTQLDITFGNIYSVLYWCEAVKTN